MHVKTHLNVFKLKHVPLDKGAADFLVGPCDEEFVVVVCLYEIIINMV